MTYIIRLNIKVSFAPPMDLAPINPKELEDRRSSMVSNGELADYYRYT